MGGHDLGAAGDRLMLEDGRLPGLLVSVCTAVEKDDGEQAWPARAVVSTIHVKKLRDWARRRTDRRSSNGGDNTTKRGSDGVRRDY